MSVTPSHLRPGNWIHRLGSSRYGIVNGALLALLEEDEKERERFEYIELSGELLEAAGFEKSQSKDINDDWFIGFVNHLYLQVEHQKRGDTDYVVERLEFPHIKHLHQLQNFYQLITASELPLPDSAKIIPQTLEK